MNNKHIIGSNTLEEYVQNNKRLDFYINAETKWKNWPVLNLQIIKKSITIQNSIQKIKIRLVNNEFVRI